jgi:hypothetical protein
MPIIFFGSSSSATAAPGLTVADLITRSLQDLNMVAAGDTPDPNDMAMGFIRLNDLIDDLKNDNLLIYTVSRTTWTLVSGTASYTIGSGATVNVLRPVSVQQISNIGYIDTSVSPVLERTFGGCLTEQEYQSVPQKAFTAASYPTAWYYDPTFGTTGYGTLRPFPIPTLSTLQGVIYSGVPVDEFGAQTDTILVPPGYRRLFRNLLTMEIASACEKPVPPAVMAAVEASTATDQNVESAHGRRSASISVGVPTVGAWDSINGPTTNGQFLPRLHQRLRAFAEC